MATSLPARTNWRPDIEGLRGLAVLLVVCFHAGVPMLRGAFVAVDVFFVLSGFFLATTLVRQLIDEESIDLEDVYGRRVWRLLPAMAVVLLSTLLSAMFLYAPIDRAAVGHNMKPVAFFAGNLAFASEGVNYFSAGQNPLLHTWTLGVEYQLVLVLPVIVAGFAMLGRMRAKHAETSDARRITIVRTVLGGIAALIVVSFLLATFSSKDEPMWAYFGPHTRLWSFAAGAAAAFFVGSGQSMFGASSWKIEIAQFTGLALILVPAMTYDRSMPYPGVITLAPVGGTLFLLAGGTVATSTMIGRVLGSSLLTWLGRVSYPWYLWHWPLMVLGSVLVPGIGAWGRLMCGLLALALAVLTQQYIERPVNKHVLPRVRNTMPFVAAMGVCLVLLLAGYAMAVNSERYVERTVHRTFAAAREDRMDHQCWARSSTSVKPQSCGFGDVGSGTTLALLGDSHAEHWLGGLQPAGRAHGWRIEANVMGGCPVSDFSTLINGSTARRYRQCTAYREAMLARIIKQKPRAVILSSFDAYMSLDGGDEHEAQVSEEAWTEGLRRTYARFNDAGIPVVVIRGTPHVPFSVPSCLSRKQDHLFMATDCTYSLDRAFIARARRAQDVAARGLNVRFIDMMDQVCGGPKCETMKNGIVRFTDDNHLTASFARSMAPVLGERLQQALGDGAGNADREEEPCGFRLSGLGPWVRQMIAPGTPSRQCLQPTGT